MIKVALNNNQNFVVKRCTKRRARINIILSALKLKDIHPPNVTPINPAIKIQEKTNSLNFNTAPSHIGKFSTFISGINLVTQEMYKSAPQDRSDFLAAFCDNSQYKITKSQRKITAALEFSKDPDNYEMMSLLRSSFGNLVGKYFSNTKTEIYLKEIILLLTKLDLVPKFVKIQSVVDVFVGL